MASRATMLNEIRALHAAIVMRACEALGFPHGRPWSDFTDQDVARLHAYLVWTGANDDAPSGIANAD